MKGDWAVAAVAATVLVAWSVYAHSVNRLQQLCIVGVVTMDGERLLLILCHRNDRQESPVY